MYRPLSSNRSTTPTGENEVIEQGFPTPQLQSDSWKYLVVLVWRNAEKRQTSEGRCRKPRLNPIGVFQVLQNASKRPTIVPRSYPTDFREGGVVLFGRRLGN